MVSPGKYPCDAHVSSNEFVLHMLVFCWLVVLAEHVKTLSETRKLC